LVTGPRRAGTPVHNEIMKRMLPLVLAVAGARGAEPQGAALAELNRMIAKPQVVAKLIELGAEPLGGTPERASAFIRVEQEKWGRVIQDVGIKLN